MKRLHLLRHAKSSWDDPSLADHERPLAPRGRKAARRIARWADEHELRVDLVVCSPALRATQTLDRVVGSLGSPQLVVDERVYQAYSTVLLDRVRELPSDVHDALLVGHNPGFAELCLLLSRPGDQRERVAENLPTGGLATIELDVEAWVDVEPGSGVLTRLVLPRELD